ncbi:hypothetical protein FRC17_002392, partial [Serendipita sp. 399]
MDAPPPPPDASNGGDFPGDPPAGIGSLALSSVVSALQTATSTIHSASTSITAPEATVSSLSSVATNNTTTTEEIDASTTENLPVQITNAFSLAACLVVIAAYIFFRRRNKRIMQRPSLVLAVSMASADAVLHTINLFGYTQLPRGFPCAFWGGFFYAFPTLISIFFSFCIALNTQIIFVFSKRPGMSTLKYYISIPIALSACICIPALGAGVYGYDASYDFCWYASDGSNQQKVVTRYVLTFGFWCLAVMLYLVIAAITIIYAVFSKSSRLNQLTRSLSKSLGSGSSPHSTRPRIAIQPATGEEYRIGGDMTANGTFFYTPTQSTAGNNNNNTNLSLKSEFESEPVTPVKPGFRIKGLGATSGGGGHTLSVPNKPQQHPTLSRRSLAMRALAFRLLGYILIPTICILPGVVTDLITKVSPATAAHIPDQVSTMFDTLNGLVGIFNAILFALDPALLALYHQMQLQRKERKCRQLRGDPGSNDQAARNFDIELAPAGTIYTTPPETPGEATPRMSNGDGRNPSETADVREMGITNDNQTDIGNGTRVEVKAGRFLSPIFIPNRFKRSERGLPSPRSLNNTRDGSMQSPGIMIRVDVEVEATTDRELERLERYLGGIASTSKCSARTRRTPTRHRKTEELLAESVGLNPGDLGSPAILPDGTEDWEGVFDRLIDKTFDKLEQEDIQYSVLAGKLDEALEALEREGSDPKVDWEQAPTISSTTVQPSAVEAAASSSSDSVGEEGDMTEGTEEANPTASTMKELETIHSTMTPAERVIDLLDRLAVAGQPLLQRIIDSEGKDLDHLLSEMEADEALEEKLGSQTGEEEAISLPRDRVLNPNSLAWDKAL